jgi:hypothetical protein
MKVFVSYAFNHANKWIEEFAIPLITALGFEVVTGRHMDGDPLVNTINDRQRGCSGCIAFTTRRARRKDGSYETHPWVLHELTTARALGQKAVEIREAKVRVGDGNEASVHINYVPGERDQMLVDLVRVLALWKSNRIRIQLVPPDADFREFRMSVARRKVKCAYEIQKVGKEEIAKGEARIIPEGDGCFVDIDIPSADVLIQIFIMSEADNTIAWASAYTGLLSIPVILH